MKISIITINYNNAEGLRETLKSIKSQIYKNYELLLIDGDSTDNSISVIEEYGYEYISEPDNGPFDAMNKGIKKATGDYCIFMNSGDSFYNETVLKSFVELHPTKDIYTGIAAEHLNGKIHSWLPTKEEKLSMRFFYRHTLSHQASFIKTSIIKANLYDTNYKIVSDWLFFVKVLLLQNVTYEPLPFFVCNYMDGGISRNAEKAFAEREKALKQLFGLRIMRDFHTMQYGTNEWDAISKHVDSNSKLGKLILIITKSLLTLRKLLNVK